MIKKKKLFFKNVSTKYMAWTLSAVFRGGLVFPAGSAGKIY